VGEAQGVVVVVAVVVTALVDVPDGGILDATHRGGEDAAAPLHRVFAIRSDHFIFQGTYYYRRKKRVIRTSPPIEEEADALNKIKKGGMDYGDGWLVLAHVWLVLHSLVRIPFFFFFCALVFSVALFFILIPSLSRQKSWDVGIVFELNAEFSTPVSPTHK
jgi:hypothetical protein